MGAAAIGVIGLYRQFGSPYKGFRCAHHALHECGSCSDYGLSVFARNRLPAAVALMRARFKECKAAAIILNSEAVPPSATSEDGESTGRKKSFWSGSWWGCDAAEAGCYAGACAFDGCSW